MSFKIGTHSAVAESHVQKIASVLVRGNGAISAPKAITEHNDPVFDKHILLVEWAFEFAGMTLVKLERAKSIQSTDRK